MFKVGDTVEIRPVLENSRFEPFTCKVVDARNVTPARPGVDDWDLGWYVVENVETGQQHDALARVTFAKES